MARKMSHADLARRAGVSSRQVYLTMQGRANLRDSTIGKYAEALGTTVEYLRTGNERVRMVRDGGDLYMAGPSESSKEEWTVAKALRVLAEQFELTEAETRRKVLGSLGEMKMEKR